jgi:hypothetical protein
LTLFYSQKNLILFFDVEYVMKRVGSRLALALLLGKLKPREQPNPIQSNMTWDGMVGDSRSLEQSFRIL